MNLLPAGLKIVEKTEPIRVEICRADPDGPAFVVEVKRMSKEQFTDLVERNKLPPNVDPKSKTAKKLDLKFQNQLCKKAIIDWEGLTVDNFKELFPHSDVEIDSEETDADAYASGAACIPYSHDLAVYIYRKSWGDEFAGPIFEALKNGSNEDEDADDALKNE